MRRKKRTSPWTRLLKTRKILVVTDQSVDYYPLGRGIQLATALAVIGFISWASYSTGSYMAAKSQIREKDKEISEYAEANRKIESEFAMLKRDFSRVAQNGGAVRDSGEYEKYILGQYENDKLAGVKELAYGSFGGGGGQSLMQDRMNFLEKRVEDLKKEKQDFVDAVFKVTKGRITRLQSTIGMTGLNAKALQRKQDQLSENDNADKSDKVSNKAVAQNADNEEIDSSGPQGGPYIPIETSKLSSKEIQVFEQLDKMDTLERVVEKLPLAIPMRQFKYTSGFGSRYDPFTGRLARHMGIDFSGPSGAPVYATQDGRVATSGWKGSYGNTIDLEHALGVSTRYGHLSRIMVNKGDKIKKGQLIGIQGSTGRSTGPHLHYEVRYDDNPLNPKNFIKAGQNVSKND
jgi:murein DD-endopeptidase MepM/ murein hydrolase activator NlpD